MKEYCSHQYYLTDTGKKYLLYNYDNKLLTDYHIIDILNRGAKPYKRELMVLDSNHKFKGYKTVTFYKI